MTSSKAEGPGRGAVLYPVMKKILGGPLRTLYRLTVSGLENVPEEGPVVLASNHLSFMDSVLIPVSVPRRVVYLAKSEYFDSWKTAWLVRGLGMIPVQRGAAGQAQAVLEAACGVLLSGGVVGLYPEGTRSADGRLHKGRTGVARLAVGTGAPVVPVGIRGTDAVMPKGARIPQARGNVTVRFGAALNFDTPGPPDNQALREITNKIMAAIMEISGQEFSGTYAPKATKGNRSECCVSDEALSGL